MGRMYLGKEKDDGKSPQLKRRDGALSVEETEEVHATWQKSLTELGGAEGLMELQRWSDPSGV